ncbi:hypothetical protein [Acinetobacter phage A2.1]|nr:hypothetical protein [Acinetobacter phage P711]WNT46425.1 hypothetical protein [Acinetobacter phage A2.1]WNT46510.1 hypothetical protein [Acinetobacter phage A832.1]
MKTTVDQEIDEAIAKGESFYKIRKRLKKLFWKGLWLRREVIKLRRLKCLGLVARGWVGF